MGKKVIALGNKLCRDDGIGIYVVEYLEKPIKKLGVDVFYGETDLNYCLSIIKNKDYIIFIDAVSFNVNPGQVTKFMFSEVRYLANNQSQHELSIFSLLDLYDMNIAGVLIGIEIKYAEWGIGLSPTLKGQFQKICKTVFTEIEKLVE